MSFGFKVRNAYGWTVVDDESFNLALDAFHTVTTNSSGEATVSFANFGERPHVFVRCDLGKKVAINRFYSDCYTMSQVRLISAPSTVLRIGIFRKASLLSPVSNYGIRVFNGLSQMVFDGGRRCLNIDVIQPFSEGSAFLPKVSFGTRYICLSSITGFEVVVSYDDDDIVSSHGVQFPPGSSIVSSAGLSKVANSQTWSTSDPTATGGAATGIFLSGYIVDD